LLELPEAAAVGILARSGSWLKKYRPG